MSHWLELFVHWAAGFGLNYNFCSTPISADPWWTER